MQLRVPALLTVLLLVPMMRAPLDSRARLSPDGLSIALWYGVVVRKVMFL